MKIITNNVPRDLVYGYALTEKERAEFDYISDDDMACRNFFRYKGNVYDLGEFTRILTPGGSGGAFAFYDHDGSLSGWDGIVSDTHFSGILVKYVGPDYESLIVGRFCE